MKTLKILRNSNLIFLLAVSFFTFSCSQYELQNNKFDTDGMELAKAQLSSNYASSFQSEIQKRGNDVVALNKELMAHLQEENGTKFEIPEYIYSLNNLSAEENYLHAMNSGFLEPYDLEKLDKFVLDIKDYDFETAIGNLKTAVSNEELTRDKFTKWNMMVQGMELAKDQNPSMFRAGECDWIDCVIATVAFVAAFIGLVTLEVGTAGLATAVVVIGYIAASAAWVRACGDCY